MTLDYILFTESGNCCNEACLQAGRPYVVWDFVNVLKNNNCCLLNGELCKKGTYVHAVGTGSMPVYDYFIIFPSHFSLT